MDAQENSTAALPDKDLSRTWVTQVWLAIAIVTLIFGYAAAKKYLFGDATAGAQSDLLQVSFQDYNERKYAEAITAAQAYLRTNPTSAPAYNNIAVSDVAIGQYDEALRNVEEALRLDPNFQLAKNNLAWIASLRQKSNGTNPPAVSEASNLVNLSLQHYNARRYPECIAAAKGALKLDPNFAEAYNNIAACETSVKNYDAAIAAAQEAIRLRPDFQLARNNLAWAVKERAGR